MNHQFVGFHTSDNGQEILTWHKGPLRSKYIERGCLRLANNKPARHRWKGRYYMYFPLSVQAFADFQGVDRPCPRE